jgi:hypothetical protein
MYSSVTCTVNAWVLAAAACVPGPFLLGMETGVSGNWLKRSHLSACRKGSNDDYKTGLRRLEGRPGRGFLSVSRHSVNRSDAHSKARGDLAPGSACGAQGSNSINVDTSDPGRPRRFPHARAIARPELTRSQISSRSNSAMLARMPKTRGTSGSRVETGG